ncbi:tyrosine-type recombinase/integrase [Halobaculum sp. CBA1158]|uniref:tyrosine-type recombinase/integrase n=1 Tax=Halobaculum sp. CBA1158 TaxID=2904243 RepID=UPI001F4578A9|nr:tyrosine-type recombinase/integrase [Halobaculum sp. CBA1158]UIO99494.1 tyrosine-type recombinase/integrase [Halobaculum sp. CBA1158]
MGPDLLGRDRHGLKEPLDVCLGNPAGVVLEEIPKQIRERPDRATWENAKKIVKAIPNPRNKAVVVLLAKTGCRLEEAPEIKMDDLMLDEGFIRLREPKGGKQTGVPIGREASVEILREVHFRFVRSRVTKGAGASSVMYPSSLKI